jgi:hypothetical protein
MKSKLALAVVFALAPLGGVHAESVPANEFKKLDTNANGYLSEAEMKPEKELSAQIDSLDKDKDGQLNETEFGGYESGASQATEDTGTSAAQRSPED